MTSTPARNEAIQHATVEQAAYWYVRHRTGELSRAEKDAFLAWLRESQRNLREYLAIADARLDLTEAVRRLPTTDDELLKRAREEGENAIVPLVGRSAPAGAGLRRPIMLGLAAFLLLILISVPLAFRLAPPTSISLPHGEQRTLVLRDGSILHVNTGSTVTVNYTKAERDIELRKGQLLVEVAHDAVRPLRVRAGVVDVVAIGTQFDVYRRANEDVTVTVLQGKVEVHRQGIVRPLPIAAGEQINISAARTTPAVQPVDVQTATAWLRREIVFERRPLGDVVSEFNRYIPVPVQIDDEMLRRRLVSGAFNAYDTESLLLYLRRHGADVEEGADTITVRARAAVPGGARSDAP